MGKIKVTLVSLLLAMNALVVCANDPTSPNNGNAMDVNVANNPTNLNGNDDNSINVNVANNTTNLNGNDDNSINVNVAKNNSAGNLNSFSNANGGSNC